MFESMQFSGVSFSNFSAHCLTTFVMASLTMFSSFRGETVKWSLRTSFRAISINFADSPKSSLLNALERFFIFVSWGVAAFRFFRSTVRVDQRELLDCVNCDSDSVDCDSAEPTVCDSPEPTVCDSPEPTICDSVKPSFCDSAES